MEIVTQTVTNVTQISQAVEAIGDVDPFYVPTDNMVVSGIASLVQAAAAQGLTIPQEIKDQAKTV